MVRVNMGAHLQPQEVPFDADARNNSYRWRWTGQTVEIGAVSMGNPHAVLLVDDTAAAPVEVLGPLIEHHPRFPRRANVGFLQVDSRHASAARSSAAPARPWPAAPAPAPRWWLVVCAACSMKRVEVQLPGGTLVVSWAGDGDPVWMTGPAASVFDGRIDLDRLMSATLNPVQRQQRSRTEGGRMNLIRRPGPGADEREQRIAEYLIAHPDFLIASLMHWRRSTSRIRPAMRSR